MQILIQVHYIFNDMKALRRGYFNVDQYKFKKNPDETAAKTAKQWISEIKREYIFNIEVIKVLYDNNDITELVKD